MKLDKVESVSSLVSAMEAKRAEAEAKRGSLKAEMDQLMDEADKLEAQAKAKRRDAKDLYKQIGALDYGNWVSDVMWPWWTSWPRGPARRRPSSARMASAPR